jgi:membrane protein DedA with SNARE-associated domain
MMFEHVALSVFLFFKNLGMFGAFLSMFIENIGIPLPTEIGYLISQDLINRKVHSYFLVLLILTFGHVFGSIVSYGVGRWGNGYVVEKLKERKKVQEVREKLEKWYKDYGNITVFATRFIGYVRPWSSLVAGFAGISFWPFLLWTSVGSLLFNIMTLYMSSIFLAIWRRYAIYHSLIVTAMVLSFCGLIIYELIQTIRNRAKRG